MWQIDADSWQNSFIYSYMKKKGTEKISLWQTDNHITCVAIMFTNPNALQPIGGKIFEYSQSNTLNFDGL